MKTALTLFILFFKIGITSFGGGYGMLSMMLDEGSKMVGLTVNEFADMTALDLICPGTVALNSATYIGYIKGGFIGMVLAIPSALIGTDPADRDRQHACDHGFEKILGKPHHQRTFQGDHTCLRRAVDLHLHHAVSEHIFRHRIYLSASRDHFLK